MQNKQKIRIIFLTALITIIVTTTIIPTIINDHALSANERTWSSV